MYTEISGNQSVLHWGGEGVEGTKVAVWTHTLSDAHTCSCRFFVLCVRRSVGDVFWRGG